MRMIVDAFEETLDVGLEKKGQIVVSSYRIIHDLS